MTADFLIYAERRTSRLAYIVNELFESRFGLHAKITVDREEFGSFHGPKLNYSRESLWSCPQIIPAVLLFEKRIQEQEIDVRSIDGIPTLYSDKVNQLGHDPLAASFYLLSRYEEYIPYRHDEHGRFTSESSIVSKHNAIEIPLVDHYANSLKVFIEEACQISLKSSGFNLEVTVDVDQLLMYRSKGIARTFIGAAKDAFVDQRALGHRFDVMLGQKRDPLDVYDEVIAKCATIGKKPVFFFQVGETSRFDINNPIHLPNVINKINGIGMDAEVGIHPSYFTSVQPDLLEKEIERLRRVTSNTITRSRQHYLRFRLPTTYQKLEELGIEQEYSMGFPDVNGFRAGTSVPFRFYDLEREEATQLVIHPLIYMDMISVRSRDSLAACIEDAARLKRIVESVGGVYSTVWHPEVLIGQGVAFPSLEILNSLIPT